MYSICPLFIWKSIIKWRISINFLFFNPLFIFSPQAPFVTTMNFRCWSKNWRALQIFCLNLAKSSNFLSSYPFLFIPWFFPYHEHVWVARFWLWCNSASCRRNIFKLYYYKTTLHMPKGRTGERANGESFTQ